MKRILVVLALAGINTVAFAQSIGTGPVGNGPTGTASAGTITNGTNAAAQQQSSINNTMSLGGGGPSDVTYHGSYSVKSAPTVYAPALTASITETCWGSVSGGLSLPMGVGITGAATIKDYDCNRRLTAAVAGRMGRMDIAFNLMCQDDQFKAAAALTDKPCPSNLPIAKQGTEIVPAAKDATDAAKTGNLTSNLAPATMAAVSDPTTGQLHYAVAQIPAAKP